MVSAEIENVEPQYDSETQEFASFASWSASTVRLASLKITSVEGPKLGQEVPARVIGRMQLNLDEMPEASRARFIRELEQTSTMGNSTTLYLLKFSRKEGAKNDLKLMRGATVLSLAEKAQDLSTVTIEVAFDGAQYRMDMLKLAVADSMFVEESYAAC